jgi:hypothetical protein
VINIDKDLYKGFPNILSCLPEGTRLIPYEGEWLIKMNLNEEELV